MNAILLFIVGGVLLYLALTGKAARFLREMS